MVFITQPQKGDHCSPEAIFNGGFWKSESDSGERGIELTFERETTIKSFRFKIPGKKSNDKIFSFQKIKLLEIREASEVSDPNEKETWSPQNDLDAELESYGGDWRGCPVSNLKNGSGMWHSRNCTQPRGVVISFDHDVIVDRFLGYFFIIHLN